MKLKYPPNWIISCSEMGGNKGKQTSADFVYQAVTITLRPQGGTL